jgi:hypothetical protein
MFEEGSRPSLETCYSLSPPIALVASLNPTFFPLLKVSFLVLSDLSPLDLDFEELLLFVDPFLLGLGGKSSSVLQLTTGC